MRIESTSLASFSGPHPFLTKSSKIGRHLSNNFSMENIFIVLGTIYLRLVVSWKQPAGLRIIPLDWLSDDATVLICSDSGVAHSSDVLFLFGHSQLNISSICREYDAFKGEYTILFYRGLERGLSLLKFISEPVTTIAIGCYFTIG